MSHERMSQEQQTPVSMASDSGELTEHDNGDGNQQSENNLTASAHKYGAASDIWYNRRLFRAFWF